MNILQVLPELNYGGVETGVLDFSKYLVEHGHKAVVVCNGGALIEELKANGVIYYQLPVDKKSPISIFKTVPKLIEIIKKENIDLVHARSRVPAWISYFASRKAQVTFITTAHGYYSRHIFSNAMGWGKLVIAVSKVIARHMVEGFGVPYERIRIIPRGVNLKRFEFILPSNKKHHEVRIGIIGRLSPIKGYSYFLRAMAKVARIKPFVKIWIIGEAKKGKENYKDELTVLVRRLGLGHCVEFLGRRQDIPQLLNQLDISVLSSIVPEAFGRVILESQAAGVPVVATSVGGVVDIIDDNLTGLLVPARDVESLASRILCLIEDKNLCDNLAKNARKKLEENFTLEIMADKTIDVYKEALKIFNILVIKLTALGDAILISPSLRSLRKKFPLGTISCLTTPESAEVLRNCPYINELIIYDSKNKHKGLKGLWLLAKDLQKRNFNISIDFQNNRKSHLLGFLSLSPLRYGYANRKLDFLLNKKTKDIKNIG
ncbi:MAG: GT4 family glycosyltransferase PelF, partial [Candidatus Omnitrophota bacterium]